MFAEWIKAKVVLGLNVLQVNVLDFSKKMRA